MKIKKGTIFSWALYDWASNNRHEFQLENADCLATIKITGKDNCRLILFDSLGSPLAIQCFGMVRNGCTHCVLCFSELFKLAPRLLLRAMRSFLLRRWPGADLRASRFLRWPFLPIR